MTWETAASETHSVRHVAESSFAAKHSAELRLKKGGEREPASADLRRRTAQRPWRRRAARGSRGGDLRTDLCSRRYTEWRGRPPLSGWRPCP
ncbi:hypothetical protein MTO96_021975 [Rhipicephalus appendiculatus]